MIRREAGGRYSLHELIRQYAREQVEPGALAETRDRHCAYFAAFLEARQDGLWGARREVLDEVALEIDNARSAWGWAIEQRYASLIAQAAEGLSHFLDHQGWTQEGENLMAQAVATLDGDHVTGAEELALGIALSHQGFFNWALWGQAHQAKAEPLLHRSLSLLRRANATRMVGHTLHALGLNAEERGSIDEARAWHEEHLAVARAAHDEPQMSDALLELAQQAWRADLSLADQYVRDALAIARRHDFRWQMVMSLVFLTGISVQRGNLEHAQRLIDESLPICQSVNVPWLTGVTYLVLGDVAHARGDLRGAESDARIGLEVAFVLGLDARGLFYAIWALILYARLRTSRGEPARGAELLGVIRSQGRELGRLQFRFDQSREAAQEALPPEEFEAALARGAALDLEMVARDLLAESAPDAVPDESFAQPLLDPLTSRELEVLRLIADGQSNADIAAQLFLSVGTVKWYSSAIYGKLGVASRTQAISQARSLGLL
jgi:ATP/maltotriose-dependent transcriptional regulator MalT